MFGSARKFLCDHHDFRAPPKSSSTHKNFLTDPNIFQNVSEIVLKHRHIRYLDIRKNNNSISCLEKKFNRAQNVAVWDTFEQYITKKQYRGPGPDPPVRNSLNGLCPPPLVRNRLANKGGGGAQIPGCQNRLPTMTLGSWVRI